MGFGQAISSGFSKYATFQGRASRSEYWWFVLFYVIVAFVANIIDSLLGFRIVSGETTGGVSYTYVYNTGWISLIVGLVFLLPLLGLQVRRLHDIDRTGWWWWIGLVCCIGWIVLLVFYVTAGTPGPNRYGEPPS